MSVGSSPTWGTTTGTQILHRSDFHFDLPPALIAQQPLAERSASRLLVVDPFATVADRRMTDLPGLLRAGDLLVLNDTRVIPARLFGQKDSGGRVEVLVERVLDAGQLLAQVRASKRPRAGTTIRIDGAAEKLAVLGREGEFFRLQLEGAGDVYGLLQRAGHVPLPPYIERADTPSDQERYQTIFARSPGAVAAPTAGLHFDAPMLEKIRAMGVATEFLTLHVGAGTFQPLRVDDLSQHRMHAERYAVPPTLPGAIQRTRQAGGRIVAVGTTVVRALESATSGGEMKAGEGETRLFITPGFKFQAVDALLTNFHLPESTLLMLVSAFAGHARVMAAYTHAVRERYRFFSYGDAMFCTRFAD